MIARRNFGIAMLTAVLATAISCEGESNGAGPGDASVTADAGPTACGGTVCTTPTGAEFNGVTSCCMESDACGLQSPFTTHCLAPRQPGAFDDTCEPFTPPLGEEMDGCCGPDGCGALNAFMGCLSNTELGRDVAACDYDPTNDCSAVAEIPCDGAEDCVVGEHCCAKSVNAGYVRFGCFPSCEALAADAGSATWYELCHTGDTCETAGSTCHGASSLPAFLGRCVPTGRLPPPDLPKVAGEVHCGTGACGSGEKCCLRNPYEPYCTPEAENCRCHPSDAG